MKALIYNGMSAHLLSSRSLCSTLTKAETLTKNKAPNPATCNDAQLCSNRCLDQNEWPLQLSFVSKSTSLLFIQTMKSNITLK